MPVLSQILALDRCPHCAIANPNMAMASGQMRSMNQHGGNPRIWASYLCLACGGQVLACATTPGAEVSEYYPRNKDVSPDIPAKARSYLQQAIASIHAPAGAVMLAASAVDEMLKNKGLTNGSLSSRIDQAATSNLITSDMAAWAHDVRLDANDQRHADLAASLPSTEDASRVVDFAMALAEILFVLPSRVQRGRGPAAAQARRTP